MKFNKKTHTNANRNPIKFHCFDLGRSNVLNRLMITKVIYVLNVLKSSKYIIILTIAYYSKNRMISNTLIRVPIKHTQNTVNFCSTITLPWFLECYFATLHLNLFNFNKIHPTSFLIQRNLSTIFVVVVFNFCLNSIFLAHGCLQSIWVFDV